MRYPPLNHYNITKVNYNTATAVIELLKLIPFQEGSGNKCEKDYDNGVFL